MHLDVSINKKNIQMLHLPFKDRNLQRLVRRFELYLIYQYHGDVTIPHWLLITIPRVGNMWYI